MTYRGTVKSSGTTASPISQQANLVQTQFQTLVFTELLRGEFQVYECFPVSALEFDLQEFDLHGK